MWHKAKRIDLHSDFELIPLKTRTIDGVKTAYREIGKGKVVFALPPWIYSSLTYTPLALALRERVHLIMPDMPGQGGHSDDFNKPATVQNYKKFLEDFINSFGYNDFSLIGYSMGGVIAHQIATERKLTPRKVVYLSTIFNGVSLLGDNSWFISANKILRKKINIPSNLTKFLLGYYLISVTKNGPYFKRYKNSYAFKASIKDAGRMNVNQVLEMLISLLEDSPSPGWPPADTESLILYADGDSSAFKLDSLGMAKHIGIEPIVIENADHHHIFFDINKSADILLNFFVT